MVGTLLKLFAVFVMFILLLFFGKLLLFILREKAFAWEGKGGCPILELENADIFLMIAISYLLDRMGWQYFSAIPNVLDVTTRPGEVEKIFHARK